MVYENIIETSGTRYKYESWSEGVCILKGWREFLDAVLLKDLDDFISLKGEIVDHNSKSQVHRIVMGSPPKTFYLKIHRDFVKRRWETFFRSTPVLLMELKNLMHYARIGFDAMEPVAWGWRPRNGGGDGFMLVAELESYRSFLDWLSDPSVRNEVKKQWALMKTVADMLYRIHEAGLCHMDLFSWHIFLKPRGNDFVAQPIDLERTEIKGRRPWSSFLIRRKQADDLAALHLTVPWPQVSFSMRMRFFLNYRRHKQLTLDDKGFLGMVLERAKVRGRRKKFMKFGLTGKLKVREKIK